MHSFAQKVQTNDNTRASHRIHRIATRIDRLLTHPMPLLTSVRCREGASGTGRHEFIALFIPTGQPDWGNYLLIVNSLFGFSILLHSRAS